MNHESPLVFAGTTSQRSFPYVTFALFVVILDCTFHNNKDSEKLKIDKEFSAIFWMLQENYLSLPTVRGEIRTNRKHSLLFRVKPICLGNKLG